jgi:cyclomaltodextrinase
VGEVKPGVIWLAESVHAGWVAERRAAGWRMFSDGELYRAFDLGYDYDIWPLWRATVDETVPVARYLEMLRFQDCIYPGNYVKMRCVENHDQPRIMALAPSREQGLAWTAFQAFNKGALLLYAGQEAGARHRPSLFDVDKVVWGDYALQPWLTRLAKLKKDPAQMEGEFVLLEAEPAIQAAWMHPDGGLYGVFNVRASQGEVSVRLPDGVYGDTLSEGQVAVRGGKMALPTDAVIVRYEAEIRSEPVFSMLLDYQ